MGEVRQGRVAVVSGAAEGIGQAFARRLAKDGVDVVLVDRKAAEETVHEVQALGRRALHVRCDVSAEGEVAALGAEVDDRFGRCDILVNSAGIYPVQSFDDITFADWRRVLSVNLDSMFLMTKTFAPGMRARGWGRIINIASDTVSLAIPGFVHYIASKAGVIGFTRAIATELGPFGITANVIAPGLTRTPGVLARGGWPDGRSAEEFFEVAAAQQPIQRVGAPEDMAGAMSYLASDDAGFVTGQTIFVCGGLVRA